MSNQVKFVLTLLGSGAVLFLIFYLYPAKVFEVKFTGSLISIDKAETVAVSLKEFLLLDETLNAKMLETGMEMKRSLAGWMILFILIIGLPSMIAYRFSIAKKSETPSGSSED